MAQRMKGPGRDTQHVATAGGNVDSWETSVWWWDPPSGKTGHHGGDETLQVSSP